MHTGLGKDHFARVGKMVAPDHFRDVTKMVSTTLASRHVLGATP